MTDSKHYSLWLTPARDTSLSQKLQSISNTLSHHANNPTFNTHITITTFHCTESELQSKLPLIESLLNHDLQYAIDVQCKTLAYTPDQMFMTVFALIERSIQLLNLKFMIEQIVGKQDTIDTVIQQYVPHVSLLYDKQGTIQPVQRENIINDIGRDIVLNLLLPCNTIELVQCDGADYTKWSQIRSFKLHDLPDSERSFDTLPRQSSPLLRTQDILISKRNTLIDNNTHELYISNVIDLANAAVTRCQMPFTALLVLDGVVVLTATNTVVSTRNVYHHAEYNLIQQALKYLNKHQIASSIMYVSAEPCAACANMICFTGIQTLVFSMSKHTLKPLWPDSLASSQLLLNPESLLTVATGAVVSKLSFSEVSGTISSLKSAGIDVIGPINEQRTATIFRKYGQENVMLIKNMSIE